MNMKGGDIKTGYGCLKGG